ncbi:hypothetical protein AO066_18325 [Pseudomonas fluorescens]|nr:hypothetical protein AO066_18325 [Pseudomonas fluorescens]
MADENIESGFPVDGGADEKLARITKGIGATQLPSAAAVTEMEYSLKLQSGPDGRLYAAGFSFRSS